MAENPALNEYRLQLRSQNVGFLLGAGCSFLDGAGFPLAAGLWLALKSRLRPEEQSAIERQFGAGASSLEEALDRTDPNSPLRDAVAHAIADHFRSLAPPLDQHMRFVKALSLAEQLTTHVFTLNYDPLIERAADQAQVRLTDGFVGTDFAFYDPRTFDECCGIPTRDARGKLLCNRNRGTLTLYKLHGSVGWCSSPASGPRRIPFASPLPSGASPLLIPPHHTKANAAAAPPFSSLWTLFRSRLIHGPRPLNRLIAIGYGLQDEHVNDVLNSALQRPDFSLVAIAPELREDSFARWSSFPRTTLITRDRAFAHGSPCAGCQDSCTFDACIRDLETL